VPLIDLLAQSHFTELSLTMDKSKVLVLLSFLIIVISNLCIGAENEAYVNLLDSRDSIQLEYRTRIVDAANDKVKRIEAHYEFGEYLDNEGETEASIHQFETAFRIAQDIKIDEQIARVGNYLANMYAATGNFKASNETYKIALTSAEKTKNNGEIAKISMNLASNYNYTGEYEKAIEYGLYALKTKETTQNLERICYHYIAMGNIFRENNNTVKWEEYVKKAYKMKDVEGCASFGDLAKIYNSLGGIAVQKGELGKGLLYYDTLLALSNEAGYEQGICTALTNSAGVYKQLGNYDKALELANEAEMFFGDNPYDVLFNNNFKAELYQLKGQFMKGLELASGNLKIEEIENYSTEKLKTLQLLYELNYHLKNWDKAFFWNDSLRVTESRLRDEDIRQSLEELETRYEIEKKEQQIELLTAENKLKNQRINAGIALLVVLLIVILLIVYIQQIRKKQSRLKQNELQQQVLRAQMNPHFIFNVLGSIQNFMMQNDNRKASDYLSRFALLTRATLNNSVTETISLADEIEMLRNYIELEKMRCADSFDYLINYDEALEVDFIHIPPMLIQPFVENSIKHGFKNLKAKGLLSLNISDKTDWVEFVIEDNGAGIQQQGSKAGTHLSMANTIFEKRRKLIQQKHNKDFKFEKLNLKDTNPELSGVRISIQIPILNND
jgi:tetratricopeptide (TPR) repeat protein